MAFLLLFVVLLTSFGEGRDDVVDNRRTIVKAGYGVNFERVSELIVDPTSAPHMWRVPWPNIDDVQGNMTRINCSFVTRWKDRCLAINAYVDDIENIVNAAIKDTRRRLAKLEELFPLGEAPPPPPSRRERRDTLGASERDKELLEGYDVFPQINEVMNTTYPTKGSSKYDAAVDVLKYATGFGIMSTLASSLGNTPGPGSINKFKKMLGTVMQKGVLENMRGVQMLSGMTVALADKMNASLGATKNGILGVNRGLVLLQGAMNSLQTRTLNALATYKEDLNLWSAVNTLFIMDVTQAVFKAITQINQLLDQLETFEEGVMVLLRGKLSPLLIPEQTMQTVLDTWVSESAKKQDGYKLMSVDPKFYYRTSQLTFIRIPDGDSDLSRSSLHIRQELPLVERSGSNLMTVYRVDDYKVPENAGVDVTSSSTMYTSNEKGEDVLRRESFTGAYTEITNTADFFAVTADQEEFLEIDAAVFLTCEGDANVRTCPTGLSVRRRRTAPTCTYSIFTDDDLAAQHLCDFKYAHYDQSRAYISNEKEDDKR